MIVTWCLCDACGDHSQVCALKLCIWSLHMRLVLPVLNHKVYSYILGKKISNLHESLSWEPTLDSMLRPLARILGKNANLKHVLEETHNEKRLITMRGS